MGNKTQKLVPPISRMLKRAELYRLCFFCFQLVFFLLVPLLTIASSPSLPSRRNAQRPNILFAIADDWGYGHASAYGSKFVRTPAFDRVARDGLLFRRAFTPNAKCAPSRAIIMTG